MGSIVRVGIKSMKVTMRAQPQSLPRATEAELADYGRVVRAIEVADSEGARTAQCRKC